MPGVTRPRSCTPPSAPASTASAAQGAAAPAAAASVPESNITAAAAAAQVRPRPHAHFHCTAHMNAPGLITPMLCAHGSPQQTSKIHGRAFFLPQCTIATRAAHSLVRSPPLLPVIVQHPRAYRRASYAIKMPVLSTSTHNHI